MKFLVKTITVNTQKAFDFVKLNAELNQVVKESGLKKGFVLVRSNHTTAALICNEDDPTVLNDLEKSLRNLLPDNLGWSHTMEGINNARAHQAVSLLGQTHWLPIENGQLKLGTWQSLFLVELFQARTRKVEVIVVGE